MSTRSVRACETSGALRRPDPYDLTDIDLSEYKGIVAPWNNWRAVQAQCTSLAAALMTPPR
jgi:hypothetical protein